ncbi:MAG: ATP-binding cassette domain-containing protein [Calditrichaeota bacterium]|nr:MAG: ATP-binding cassette domain-containing protein [Calditrichota bacterium]
MLNSNSYKNLKPHNAFAKISPLHLNSIMQKGEFVEIPLGEMVCEPEQESDFLFFLYHGSALLLSSEGKVVSELIELNGHCGWNEFEEKYPYTVIVMSEMAIFFKIHKSELQKLFKSSQHIKDNLFLYRIPFGAYNFFKVLNIPGFSIENEDVISSMEIEFYKSDTKIVLQNEVADKFYIIVSGEVKVSSKDEDGQYVHYGNLYAGDFFGELALLEDSVRTANVTCVTDCTLVSLTKENFQLFLETQKGNYIKSLLKDRSMSYTLDIENVLIGSSSKCLLKINSDNIAPQHAKIVKFKKKDGSIRYTVQPIATAAQYKTFVNKQLINSETVLEIHDELTVGDYKIIIDFLKDSIRFQKIDFHTMYVDNLFYSIKNLKIIDNVSFAAESNEMVCILGPSGAGKSTILELIYGSKIQNSGYIFYDDEPLTKNIEFYRSIFGYVPQDDMLMSELTVYQNLYFTAKLREPFVGDEILEKKIDIVLERLKLYDKKNEIIGSLEQKGLSGGERKRVNIAKELIFDPHIIFLDEPTSGLSSKDSEEIVSFLRNLSDMGKIVIASLHQPGSKIFQMFDKIVFMDKGGKLVFTGGIFECLDYMKDVIKDSDPSVCPECGTTQPEQIFEILEAKKENGERIFSNEFWQKRFIETTGLSEKSEPKNISSKEGTLSVPRLTLKGHLSQLQMLIKRNFLVKLQNKSNLGVSVSAPILIATLLAFILYFTPDDVEEYSFYENKLISLYFFIGVVFSIFLGLTNSVRDIVSEIAIFNMESKIKLKIPDYVLAKFIVLSVISFVQVFIFMAIGSLILEIHGNFLLIFVYLFLSSLVGIAFGLLLSSFVKSSETAVNWIPLILIPQIILGGALIKFEDMSKQLFLNADQMIPEFCQFIPSRWAHESLIVAQATLNSRDAAIQKSKEEIKKVTQEIREVGNDVSAIEQLREKRKSLKKNKAQIDVEYPNSLYKNEVIEQTVMSGTGNYASFLNNFFLLKEQKKFIPYKIFEIKSGEKVVKNVIFNAPYYSKHKGILIGKTYFEIETIYFNFLVLIFMILSCLFYTMLILKIKKILNHKIFFTKFLQINFFKLLQK